MRRELTPPPAAVPSFCSLQRSQVSSFLLLKLCCQVPLNYLAHPAQRQQRRRGRRLLPAPLCLSPLLQRQQHRGELSVQRAQALLRLWRLRCAIATPHHLTAHRVSVKPERNCASSSASRLRPPSSPAAMQGGKACTTCQESATARQALKQLGRGALQQALTSRQKPAGSHLHTAQPTPRQLVPTSPRRPRRQSA